MFNSVRSQWFGSAAEVRRDFLAGLVVALALIPEAIGFSIIAGVDPRVGLWASVAIAIVISLLGGRPGMISAATAAVAVLVTPLVRDHGVDYLFAATILMGLIQIAAGFLRLDLLMQFVSRSVITGFVNALAILIFMAQIPQLVGMSWHTYAMIAAGLAIIYLLPRMTTAVPSPLAAILVLAAVSIGFGLPVHTVGDIGKLPEALPSLTLPQVPLTWETLQIILPYSATMAAVGLLESMLTAQIVDDMTDTDSDKRRECLGQGGANIAAALVGGMGGCAMIGQSVINLKSGGRKRLSTLTAGVGLLILVISLSSWLARIPMAALVAVMIMVSISTVNWDSFLKARQIPKSDTAVMLVTLVLAVITRNLAIAVLVGVALAGILFSRKVAKVIAVDPQWLGDDHLHYTVRGQLFFVSTVYFLAGFKRHAHPARVTIDMGAAHVWDQSGMRALDQVIRKLQQAGSQVDVVRLNPESLDLFRRISESSDAVLSSQAASPL